MSEYKIATLVGGVAGLTALSGLTTPLPDPVSFWQDYQEQVDLASQLVRGVGLPVAEWLFPVLSEAARNQIKTYCSGASAVVYLRTLRNAGTYANYKAVLVWPLQERCRAGMVFELTVKFKALEVQS